MRRTASAFALRKLRALRRDGSAALICLALSILHTWPVASAPHRLSLNYNADAPLTAWIVSWIAYALPHEPQNVFKGNIFQPDDRVLSYSEPLVVPALVGAPIRWLGGSAVLTFNVLMILGLALTAFGGWWAVDRWTGSFSAGLAAGALLAFNTHLLTRLPHLQGVHAWAFPLAFYLMDRVIAEPRRERWTAAALGVVVAAVAVTSIYWFIFTIMMLAVQALIGVRSIRTIRAIAIAAVVAIVLSLPVVLLYARLAGQGVKRPLEQAAEYSATPSGYLTSLSLVDRTWSRRFFTRDVNVLFPGFIALALTGVGIRAGFKASRVRAWMLIAVGLVGLVLSFGPATPIYRLAYYVFIPLQGVRVPARFGYLVLFAVAMFAGYGVAAVARSIRSRTLAAAFGVLALAAVTAEAWHGPVPTVPFAGVPRIYAILDQEPPPVLLVEAPFWHTDIMHFNAEYVLNATEHRAPTMNGYSGLTPDLYRKRAQWFWFFPEPWAIDAMRNEGATHVMVHLEQFGAEAESVKAALARQDELELMAEDPRGHRLYRFKGKREKGKGKR